MSLKLDFPFKGFDVVDGFATIRKVVAHKRKVQVEVDPPTDPRTFNTINKYNITLVVDWYKDQETYEAGGEILETKQENFELQSSDPTVQAIMGSLYKALKTVPGLEKAVDA